MRLAVVAAVLLLVPAVAWAGGKGGGGRSYSSGRSYGGSVHVRGYQPRTGGSYRMPSYRSHPDGNRYNNYSSRGMINPFTGSRGTR